MHSHYRPSKGPDVDTARVAKRLRAYIAARKDELDYPDAKVNTTNVHDFEPVDCKDDCMPFAVPDEPYMYLRVGDVLHYTVLLLNRYLLGTNQYSIHHAFVYVGCGYIVHYTPDERHLKLQHISMLKTKCKDMFIPPHNCFRTQLSREQVATRALDMLGTYGKYDYFTHNCQHPVQVMLGNQYSSPFIFNMLLALMYIVVSLGLVSMGIAVVLDA